MKHFEIVTPGLRETGEAFLDVIRSRKNGTMGREEARDIIAAGNGFVRTSTAELKTRLALPKLVEMEAKLIEHQIAEKRNELEALEKRRAD